MSDNVTLTSLCGFSRKFLFSVDLNLKKVILQKILGSIFLKTLFTQHRGHWWRKVAQILRASLLVYIFKLLLVLVQRLVHKSVLYVNNW